jgi:DsbC/DsbD-like thiol-disulfide interchange protein
MSTPKMIRRAFTTFAALAVIAVAAPLSHAQFGMDTPAKKSYVTYTAEAQTVPAGRRGVLQLRFQLVPGFHVNSHTPKSDTLIPTALTLQPATGVKTGDLAYPPGQPFSFSFDPKEKVDVYAGAFIVKLPVVATAGEHTMDGTLKYQACDNASCYPPRTIPVKILFTAK